MYYVSWFDAIEYCNKRSVKEGLTPVYRESEDSISCDWNANGYRLPTEAEWEYAAKGGKNLSTCLYAGSNSAWAVAWYGGDGSMTHPVGIKAPNDLGLYDLSGNVWEWCWDWYGEYDNGAQIDPAGPDSGSSRIIRGGSWGDYAQSVRSSYRGRTASSRRYDDLGFRLVRAP
jgi:formylglycine-generating enzyme required for sulfatase activity